MDWVEGFADAGIEDVHHLDLVVSNEDVDAALLRMLPELKTQAARSNLTPQEESDRRDPVQHSFSV